MKSFDDCFLLLHDLNRFCDYCRKNFLFLNLEKCFQISFTRNTNKIRFDYTLDQNKLQKASSIRDLGVVLDEKLNFIEHIDNIVSSANKMLGFVFRHGRVFKKNETMLTMYYSLICSRLNFSSSIWNPHYGCHVRRLESVQHKFLRCMSYRNNFRIENHEYSEALRRFNMLTLENRRKINDMCLMFKMVSGVLSVPSLLQSVHFKVPERRLRSAEMFAVPFRRLNITKNSPICRILSEFNSSSLDLDPFSFPFDRYKRLLKHHYLAQD